MLARDYILKGKKNFEKVLNKGKMYQFPAFGMAVFKRGDAKTSVFGFIISTKISRESALRNRIRRALAESVRYEMSYLKPGFDVVFLAKTEATKKSTDEIMKETREALKRSGLEK